MRLSIPALCLLLAVWMPPSGRTQDTPLRFSGRVQKGETFRADLPGGLQFVLLATASDPGGVEGWTIQVSPKASHPTECDDFVWAVMPPYRSYNARYVDTSYGTTAEEAVKFSPREFSFVLNCADQQQEAERVNRLLWPYNFSEAQVEEARDRLGTSRQGKGRLSIRDSKVSPASVNLGQIDWIAFEVEIELPR